MRPIARCPTKTDLESRIMSTCYACTQYSYNTSNTTYLNSVRQQFQELTQFTTFAALIKLGTLRSNNADGNENVKKKQKV